MQQTLFPLRALSEEEPLERLWRRGSRSLSDAELLCVLLRSGDSARALKWAQEVLAGHWEPEGLRQQGFGRVRGGAVLHFTRRLQDAAEVSGLVLYDHLILGSGGRFVALAARPCWPSQGRILLAERRRILPETQKSNPGRPAGQEGGRRRC